jgi:hypothetical protein
MSQSLSGQLGTPTEEARIPLEEALQKGRELLEASLTFVERYDVWYPTTLQLIKSVFGERSAADTDFQGDVRVIPNEWWCSKSEHDFISTIGICPRCGGVAVRVTPDNKRRRILRRQIRILEAQIWGLPARSIPDIGFFADLDADITRVSKQLFKDKHYAEAVSAAFKELNSTVKEEYKKRTNNELLSPALKMRHHL